MAEVLTIRVNSVNAAWVRHQSEGSGLSLSAVVETYLDEARRRGWTVEPRRGAVVEDGDRE